jgi:hypothetical protein
MPGTLLEYSNQPRRRRWRRWALLLFVLVACGVSFYYRGPISRRAHVLYWQRQCMKYDRPPGTPVMVDQATAKGDRDYAAPFGPPENADFALSPQCWSSFESALQGGRVAQVMSKSLGPKTPTIFLHERISPAGHRRLVRVESIMSNALSLPYGLTADLYQPATVWRDAKLLGRPQLLNYSGRFVSAELFFGQPDPADASHFTIDFEVEGRKGVIDGWLRDDDTVQLKLRDPATTRGL